MLKFSEQAPVYSFSTENLSYLIECFNSEGLSFFSHVSKKRALTITGSGDQALILSLLGYEHIDCVDINKNSFYYFSLKLAAIKHFNFEQFKSFFLKGHGSFSYSQYLHIHQFLSFEEQNFWDTMYAQYDYDGQNLRDSSFFNHEYDKNEEKIQLSYYLQDETIYRKVQLSLLKSTFHFYHTNYLSFINRLDINNYDCTLLSNIADYSHKIYQNDYLLQFKEQFILPTLKHLNSHGICMFAYIYDTQNIFHSDQRNIINNTSVRKQYFDNIKKTQYLEKNITSAISGTPFDTVCFLKHYE